METVDYTISIDYTDDESPVLTEADIKAAVVEALEETGIDAETVRVEREG